MFAYCVHSGMELLRAEVPDAAASILDYFDRTYVHGSSRKIANSDVVRRIEPLIVSAGGLERSRHHSLSRRQNQQLRGGVEPPLWDDDRP